MIYCISDAEWRDRYDARIELDGSDVLLHSRGGATRGRPARNTEYEKALQTIIRRLRTQDTDDSVTIGRVLLDSTVARHSPKDLRTLVTSDELVGLLDEDVAKLIRQRARRWGQKLNSKGGNSTKALRFEIHGRAIAGIRSILKLMEWSAEKPSLTINERLPSDQLRQVSRDHIRQSINRILAGESVPNFSESTHYDVLLPDGMRLAPKKVFGLALEEALGIEAFPQHFIAGFGQPCFEIIQAAGFYIVGKPIEPLSSEAIQQALRDIPPDDGDISAIEGNSKIVVHIQRERSRGLSQQKKAAFVRQHGELFCERCGLRPGSTYGPYVGDACIEVHHALIQVKDMLSGHETKLEDLQCLCANCHRVTHREMALGIAANS